MCGYEILYENLLVITDVYHDHVSHAATDDLLKHASIPTQDDQSTFISSICLETCS